MTLATLTRVTCGGGNVLHFERRGDRATIRFSGKEHLYHFYESRNLSANDRGVDVLGGKVTVICRRCNRATLTVLDSVV